MTTPFVPAVLAGIGYVTVDAEGASVGGLRGYDELDRLYVTWGQNFSDRRLLPQVLLKAAA